MNDVFDQVADPHTSSQARGAMAWARRPRELPPAQVGVSAAAFLQQADLYEEIQRALLQVFSETLARVARPEALDAMLAQTRRGQAAAPAPVAPVVPTEPAAQAAMTGAGPLGALSTREYEVLQRLAAGDSNKLIARAFDLSPHTVKRHVANILNKLGAGSRGQAAAWLRTQA